MYQSSRICTKYHRPRRKHIKRFKLTITKTADDDLLNIYLHIAKSSPKSAANFVDEIMLKIHSAAESGFTGSPRDWVENGLRVLLHKDRSIYFRINNNEMVIVRILHDKQDATSQAFPIN